MAHLNELLLELYPRKVSAGPDLVDGTVSSLEARARRAPALRRLRGFVDYFSEPRALTDRGNIKLADARALVAALQTGDRMDETIGDRTFKTRSSTELTTLDLTLLAWIEVGVLTHHYQDDNYGFGWYAHDVDAEVSQWLLDLYQHGGRDIEDLADDTWGWLNELFDLSDVDPDRLELHRGFVEHGVRRILDRLVELDVVAVDGVREVPTRVGTERRGGVVALTDLGTWAVNQMASAFVEAPVAGNYVDDEAATILRRAGDLPEDVARAELDAWIAARETTSAAEELVDAVRGADPVGVGLGFEALLRVGEPAAAAVGSLQDDPRLGSYVTVWRVDTLDVDTDELAATEPAERVALLHAVLDLRGPQAIVGWLPVVSGQATADAHQRIVEVVGELWRPRSEAAREVLEAIADVHPDNKIAKAARTALYKLQSST